MCAFLSPGLTSSACTPTKLYPTRDFSAFHPEWVLLLRLLSFGTTLGTRPSCCTPIHRFPDESRYSHSHSRHRYSRSRSRHRYSHSRCWPRDNTHGYQESLPSVGTNVLTFSESRAPYPHRSPCAATRYRQCPVHPVPSVPVQTVLQLQARCGHHRPVYSRPP